MTVELALDPDPGVVVRAAIAAAAEERRIVPPTASARYEARWRLAGLAEGVERAAVAEDELPRSTAGATRA